MKTLLTIALLAITINLGTAAEDFYSLKAEKINGEILDFSELRGKKLMIVNVASFCGYTYQYGELQSLYSQYGGDNFEIIGFPANNFANQEPGTNADIEEFCTSNFNVTFTMMSKISVLNPDKHPVYQWLTLKSKNGVRDQEVQWNFNKFLINEDGTYHGYAGSQTSPLNTDIVNWVVGSTSNVEIAAQNASVSVYPNPATDFIMIEMAEETAGNITIHNLLGFEMLRLSQAVGTIDISSLPAGVYIIKIADKVARFTKM